MISSDLQGVEFVAANTDAQSLENSLAQNKIQLGINLTKGLGAGSFPECGRDAAEENIEEIIYLKVLIWYLYLPAWEVVLEQELLQ